MRSAERGALEQRLAVNDAAVARFSPKSVRASSCLCMRFLAHPLIFLACLGSPLNSGFPDPNPPIPRSRAVVEQLYLIATSPATNSKWFRWL